MADATRLRRERRKLNKRVEAFFEDNVEECDEDNVEECDEDNVEECDKDNVEDCDEEMPGSDRSRDYPVNSDTDYPFENEADLPLDSSDEYSTEDELLTLLSDDEICDSNLMSNLREWCSTSGCSREKLNNLLVILRVQGGHNKLPRDIRTLLHTPRDIVTISKCGGQYLYIGIEKGLNQTFSRAVLNSLNGMELTINIDGLPLEKSSNHQLWPILGCFNDSTKVFIIGLFCGYSKPDSVTDFLFDFLKECRTLSKEGVLLDKDTIVPFVLKSFICDAPAGAVLKCITGHTGYYSCERCTAQGKSIQHRLVYGESFVGCYKRTDEGFANNQYTHHQKGVSPLTTEINFNCVTGFPLDYMHLVLLGIVKRMLNFLIKGPPICSISSKQVRAVSEKLINLNGCMYGLNSTGNLVA